MGEPFVFAIVKSGGVEVFLNAPGPAHEEYPAFKGRPIGGTLTLFIEVDDIRASYDELEDRVQVVMPLETKWYGVTEFAFLDPDGYIITFAAAWFAAVVSGFSRSVVSGFSRTCWTGA